MPRRTDGIWAGPASADVHRFLERLTAWAAGQEDVRAVALVGSYARGSATADSDVDIVLLTTDPSGRLRDTSWVDRFGRIARRAIEPWGAVTSVRAFFDQGMEVELGIATPGWASTEPLDAGTREVAEHGLRILFDRDGDLSKLLAHLEGSRASESGDHASTASAIQDGGLDSYLEAVVDRLRGVLGDDLAGAYVHGSTALGDFDAARSDVDLLAVCSRPLSVDEKTAIATALSERELPCPAQGLELHVVAIDSLRPLGDAPPFELHVATIAATKAQQVVDGDTLAGDADLLMHYAVLRDRGRALIGPAPSRVVPPVPRAKLLEAIHGELRWAEEHGSPSYQVLNACRAWRYLEEGILCSKLEGAEWAVRRLADRSVVDQAVAHRRRLTEAHPDPDRAKELLRQVMRRMEEGRSRRLEMPGSG